MCLPSLVSGYHAVAFRLPSDEVPSSPAPAGEDVSGAGRQYAFRMRTPFLVLGLLDQRVRLFRHRFERHGLLAGVQC